MAQKFRRAADALWWMFKGIFLAPRLGAEMWRFERTLPARLNNLPLPDLMAELTPRARDIALDPSTVRELADAVAALDVRSPLGICLRRSLLRYHFLRRAGLPVTIRFGARLKESRDIGGHAWLMHDDAPFHEESENYLGFAVMYSYP